MKKISSSLIIAAVSALFVFSIASALIGNGDFETGNFTNWTKSFFINNGFSAASGAGGADLTTIVTGITPLSVSDPRTNNVVLYPAYGSSTAKVNSELSYTTGGYAKNANTISQTYTAVLDPGDGLAHVRFTYSAVMVDPVDNPHTSEEKPYFRVRVINTSNGNDVIYDFSSYVGEPGKNWETGSTFSGADTWKFIDWTYVDLVSSPAHPVNAGDSIRVEVTAAGCSLGGHPGYVYVDEISDGDIAGPSINATGPATVATGDTITYTYNYLNGASVTLNPTVTINEPVGVTFSSVSDPTHCSLSSGTATCNFTGVNGGAGDSFTVSGIVTASAYTQIAHGNYNIGAAGFPTVSGQTVLTDVTGSLPSNWDGSAIVTSDKNILTVGRPHFDTQIASYDGYSSGATKTYLPMLFKNAWGSYNSEFYVQNLNASNAALLSIKFYDIDGNLSCTINDTLAKLSSKIYSVTAQTCLPNGWVGGAVIDSDYNIVTVGRPIVDSQTMTYNSFQTGATTVYVPMLFNQVWGVYNSALYIQNLDPSNTATFSLKFYDRFGNLTCTMNNQQRAPLAAKGYWLPNNTCTPAGWAGGVVIESNYPLAALGRVHVGSEVTSYSGLVQSSTSTYVPMIFKKAFGGDYDSALYVQNVNPTTPANVTMDFYSSSGVLSCTVTTTLAPMAATGYWLPTAGCMPDGWAGSAVITSNTNVVAVGRPHIGNEVTAYPGLSSGGLTAYLPLLHKNGGPGNNYSSALYVQNLTSETANISINFYDAAGNLSCSISETLAATAVKGYWMPNLSVCP